MPETRIPASDRDRLRELARQYMDLAALPVQEDRRRLWFDHNACKPTRPPVVMELWTFAADIMPPLACESPEARGIEQHFVWALTNHRLVDDDKVVSPYFPVYWHVGFTILDFHVENEYRPDSRGVNLGFRMKHPVHDIAADLEAFLKPSPMSVNREATLAWKQLVEETVGDICPVRFAGTRLAPCIPDLTVRMMGMEAMMLAMFDHPDAVHRLHQRAMEEHLRFFRWLESERLLVPNNGDDQIPSGGYGFTDLLPQPDAAARGFTTTRDLWFHMSAQEMAAVSPEMYGEFVFPYYKQLAAQAGFLYNGCCEPVHAVWDKYIQHLPNLRAVAVTRWCDEPFMGEALRGRPFLYSRKPDPTLVGVGEFSPDAFRAHIAKTLTAARGCHLEFIFRDIYTLCNDPTRAGRAVKIVREEIQKHWT